VDKPVRRTVYEFGGFRVDAHQRLLLLTATGRPLPLSSRAFDLLLFFLEHPGELLDKPTLMAAVWPKVVVEENNLNQHIFALRRVLGERPEEHRFIVTVPGRGYRFVAAVLPVPDVSGEALGIQSAAATRRFPRLPLVAATAGAVLLAAGFAWWHRQTMQLDASPTPPLSAVAMLAGKAGPLNPKSIAVLPFLDLSEKKDEGFFADGMTEEITSLLSQVPDLRVSARTSAFYFKDHSMPVGQIGNALGAASVLEGSVRKAGALIRVTVQLIRTDTGYHVWSASYERRPDDLFATQTEIARAVVSHLQASLVAEDSLRDPLSSNSKARSLYLTAGMGLRSETRAGLHGALTQLQAAVAEDPQFARAWALLAFARLQSTTYDDMPAAEVRPLVTQAIERALAIDPTLADAHAMKSQLLWSDWNIRDALTEAHRALDSDPNNVGALLILAQLEELCGHYDESIRLSREVVRRDPLSASTYEQLGQTLWFAGREQDAIETFQTALTLNPRAAFYHYQLAVVQLTAGDAKAALNSVEQGRDEEESAILRPVMLDALGQHAEAEKEQQIAEKRFGGGTACHDLAIFYARRGDADHAMPLLEQCYRNHDFFLPLLKGDPLFRRLQPNPIFQAMIRRFDIPE